MIYNCNKCGVELTDDNWQPSCQKKTERICRGCNNKRSREWREANPEKTKESKRSWAENNPEKTRAANTRRNRKNGQRPMSENKECTLYLGVYRAEQALSQIYPDVVRMPMNNPNYDFICNKGKKVDSKCSCLNKAGRWSFNIKRNTEADYFICLAFDNRDDLNPLHIWLLPGDKFNHLSGASLCPNTVDKWDEYRLKIGKVITGCNAMR